MQNKATLGEILFSDFCFRSMLSQFAMCPLLLFPPLTDGPHIQRKERPKRNNSVSSGHLYIWELKARFLDTVFVLQKNNVQNETHGYLCILTFLWCVHNTHCSGFRL